jgi:predicted RNA binding protein YcfA (HicA-like mRNA interferase family)
MGARGESDCERRRHPCTSVAGKSPGPSKLNRGASWVWCRRGIPFYVKVRAAIKLIEREGWYHVRTRGSHRQYRHDARPGLVTIPGKLSDDLAPGTWKGIRKQAGLKT